MGQLKQLLPLNGKPMIRHCLDSIVSSGIRDIVVVLGSREPEMTNALNGLPVSVVFNEEPESEMTESVRTGLREADGASTGILVSLADQPLVSSETIMALVSAHAREPDKIIVPVYKTKKGHPVLLPRSLLIDIFKGGTMRDVINRHSGRVRMIPVMDKGVVLDVDTVEDYRKIEMMFRICE
jgi:molybdenum cofactor cytidylyltransferase